MIHFETALRDAVEKGRYEPYRHHFIEAESIKEDADAGSAPKPYLIELYPDGAENFECPHSTMVMHWSEGDDSRVNWENNELAFSTDRTLLDPAFWVSLFGAKIAEEKAVEFLRSVFSGGTPESFFQSQYANRNLS